MVDPRLDLSDRPLGRVEGPWSATRRSQRRGGGKPGTTLTFLSPRQTPRAARTGRRGCRPPLGTWVVARGRGGVEGPGGQVGVEDDVRLLLRLFVALRGGGGILLAAAEELPEGALRLGQRPVGALVAEVAAFAVAIAFAFGEGFVFPLPVDFFSLGGGRRRGAGLAGGVGGVGARASPRTGAGGSEEVEEDGEEPSAEAEASLLPLALALLLGIAALLLLRLLLLYLPTLCDLFFLVGGEGSFAAAFSAAPWRPRREMPNSSTASSASSSANSSSPSKSSSKLREELLLVEFLVVSQVFVAFIVVVAAA